MEFFLSIKCIDRSWQQTKMIEEDNSSIATSITRSENPTVSKLGGAGNHRDNQKEATYGERWDFLIEVEEDDDDD